MSSRAVLDAWADAHWRAAHPSAERVRVVRLRSDRHRPAATPSSPVGFLPDRRWLCPNFWFLRGCRSLCGGALVASAAAGAEAGEGGLEADGAAVSVSLRYAQAVGRGCVFVGLVAAASSVAP